jgi:hypothetical protein
MSFGGADLMSKTTWILSFLALWSASSAHAQLYARNGSGITLGSVHTIVRNVETTKKFWALFDGKPMTIDGVDVIKLPGAFIFLHQAEPGGPSQGSIVDHIGVVSPNPYQLIKRLVAAGVKTDPVNPTTLRDPAWVRSKPQQTWTHVYSPDGLGVEIETDPCVFTPPTGRLSANDVCPETLVTADEHGDPSAPIGFGQLHFYLKDNDEVKAFRAFYTKYFGAEIIRSTGVNFQVRGAKLVVEPSPDGGRASNKGRALDSIGFEVKGLEEFCKKLEAAGVKFDEPYSKTRYQSVAHASFTDQWGVRVQLTEGLKPVCPLPPYQGPFICPSA